MTADTEGTHRFEIDCLHQIGNHIAIDDSLDETLASVISFATALVNCDSCFTYVLEADKFEPWVWKTPEPVDQSELELGRDLISFLAQHRAAVASSATTSVGRKLRVFDEWSQDPGESFISVPFLSRSKLVGAINLQHRRPRAYIERELKALSTAGFLVGAEIAISLMKAENSKLYEQLETRKLVERSKGILQRELGLSEEQAYLILQRQSRQRRKTMKEIAQAIIMGDEVKRSSAPDERIREANNSASYGA